MYESTTMITGVSAIGASALSVYDRKNKKIDKERAKSIGIRLACTSLATTGTAITGACINNYTLDQIHQKYSSAYIESMSDEELAKMLSQLDLLEADMSSKEDIKTL